MPGLKVRADWAKLRPTYCVFIKWLPWVLGASLALISLGGLGLNLDIDQKWGEVRTLSLAAGLLLLLLLTANELLKFLDSRTQAGPSSRGNKESTDAPSGVSTEASQQFGTARHLVFLLVVLGMYLGLVTVWNWPRWPVSSYHYNELAQAFSHGSLSLEVEADPSLATLDNPYDPDQRDGLDVIGDLSYYEGHYYMYWGPAPAAISALWLLVGGVPVSDAVIVFLSAFLAAVFGTTVVITIYKTYFPFAPKWLVLLALTLVASAHPVLWTLNSPSIYTAAISASQAFLLGGLYFWLKSLESAGRFKWRPLTAGSLFALAVGSRLTVLPAVVLLVFGWVYIRFKAMKRVSFGGRRGQLLALMLPVAIGIALLGAYNFARFGSAFETGFRYQLVGFDQSVALRNGTAFNLRYFLPNLLHYLFAPIRIVADFPFVRPWWGSFPPFVQFGKRLGVPAMHSVQNAVGLAFLSPALVMGVIFSYRMISCSRSRLGPAFGSGAENIELPTLKELGLVLLAAETALAAPTILYRVSAMRFMMEVVPLFSIISAVGIFSLHSLSEDAPFMRGVVNTSMVLLVAVSAAVSFLMALNGADSRFDDANPALYFFLVNLFSR